MAVTKKSFSITVDEDVLKEARKLVAAKMIESGDRVTISSLIEELLSEAVSGADVKGSKGDIGSGVRSQRLSDIRKESPGKKAEEQLGLPELDQEDALDVPSFIIGKMSE